MVTHIMRAAEDDPKMIMMVTHTNDGYDDEGVGGCGVGGWGQSVDVQWIHLDVYVT